MAEVDNQIKRRWDNAAASSNKTLPDITLQDVNQRELEIHELLNRIPQNTRILDVGCGTGYSTCRFASEKNVRAVGIDYSENMIQTAQKYLEKNLKTHKLKGSVCFQVANVLDLPFEDNSFDIVISERCLINLPSKKKQLDALGEIRRVLTKGGSLLLLESTKEGYENISTIRKQFGLEEIRPVWHNLPFVEEELIKDFTKLHFETTEIFRFSTYYFLSRLVYPLTIFPKPPRYKSRFNEMARKIAMKYPHLLDQRTENLSPLVLFVARAVDEAKNHKK